MGRKNNSKSKLLKKINKDISKARKKRNKDYKNIINDVNNIQVDWTENRDNLTMKMSKNKDLLIGKFVGNERGFGFVEIEGRDEDIFIPASCVKSAMNGDIVAVRITEDKDANNIDDNENNKSTSKRRAEGTITEILQRNVKTVVGVYTKSKNFGFVVADDKKLSSDIYIPKNFRGKAKTNDKVVVEIIRYPESDRKAEGRIIEILGNADDTNVDLLAVMRAYGYKKEFPKDVQKEANMMPQVVLNANGRIDLRDEQIFTIDGADTKDIDDAISLKKAGNNKYLLGVHIADVSNYVREGTPLDKEAVKRGTSVYLIDAVIPMLPKELSNGICSLNPDEDRNALSIDILLDNDANILNSKIYKSVIRSKKKMTYDNVYKVIEQNETPEGYEPFVDTLMLMKELALKLIDKRHNEGAIDFDVPETKIILDENDKVVDIKPFETTLANRIIEQFMVLANECVAKTFSEKQLPFIYRVHEQPDVDKLQRFKTFLNNLNYTDNFSEEIKPKEIQKVVEESKGKIEEKVVSMMALRAMQLAKYNNENLGHFGLALKNYCHFTSPIRRYPDLFIHRVISEYLAGNLDEKQKKKFAKLAIKYSESSSDMEQKAEEAERDLEDIKKCEYMEEHIGEEFEGIISGVTNFGIFVELENTIEGLVHVENMKDDYYNYDELSVSMIGERTRKVYKMGDKIRIKVVSTDRVLKRIDFEIV
ncbi:MAG: ribonuclease R [Clostridia bacterium]|nr:ribonuclease R [Clostridia bacterium]